MLRRIIMLAVIIISRFAWLMLAWFVGILFACDSTNHCLSLILLNKVLINLLNVLNPSPWIIAEVLLNYPFVIVKIFCNMLCFVRLLEICCPLLLSILVRQFLLHVGLYKNLACPEPGCSLLSGQVVSVLDCQSLDQWFKSSAGQRYASMFLTVSAPLAPPQAIMGILTVHCQWDDEKERERTGH